MPKGTARPPAAIAEDETDPDAARPAGDAGQSRTDAVHRGLRQAIIEQRLLPGTKLPEDAIGESFGASRTIAREALGRLAVEGLVELRLNKGAYVASPSLEEARDVFAVRGSLERLVCSTLAGRLTAADAAALRRHVDLEEAARGRDEAESIRLAGEFHLMLARLTANAVLIRYVTEVVSRCSLILAMYARPHSADCAVTEHLTIVDALERGDAAAAAAIMDEHLEAVAGRAHLKRPVTRSIQDILAPYAGPLAPRGRRKS